MSCSNFMDAIMLFGDSLTEAPTAGSLHQRMAERYIRRLDVVNRGFSGYNSDWAIPVLKQILASKSEQAAGKAQKIRLVTIWFGANDSVFEGEPQHVPLDRYKANLSRLVDMISSPSSEYYSPDTKIVLINAPPLIVHKWAAKLAQIRIEVGEADPHKPSRSFEQSKVYSAACLDVARSHNLPCVDIFAALIQAAGGSDPNSLDPYLYDGLHLSPSGYEVLQEELLKVIEAKYPELAAEAIPMRLAIWRDIDVANPSASLGE